MTTLQQLSKNLRQLPKVIASRVTEAAAPALTEVANETFEASTDPYGAPWEPAKDGSVVTLEKTGALKRFLRYVAIGTKLRVSLGVPYAKYQIGKRPVFPRQGAALPPDYVQALTEATSKAVTKTLAE